MLERMWKKENPPTLWVGMYIGAATVESSMEVPQKAKNYQTIQQSHSWALEELLLPTMQRGDGWVLQSSLTVGKEDLEAGLRCTAPGSPLAVLHP